jgi:hypothetical protein
MPAVRALVLLVGGLVTVALILFAALQIVGGFSRQETDEPVAFPAGVRHIVIDVEVGSVELRGGASDNVGGVRQVLRGFGRPTVDEHIDGDTLRITSRCSAYLGNWCATAYVLDVPRSVSVEALSSAGHVLVAGIDGDVQARTHAGAVTIDDTGGRLDLSASSGRIEGTRLRGGVATAEASAGRVTLAFAVPPTDVTARSSAGSVEVVVPDDGTSYRVDADSSVRNADVLVATDPGSDRVISARTSAGAVDIAYATP